MGGGAKAGPAVKGFEFSAVSCGIKKGDLLDLALIHSRRPADAAGAFTTNRVAAAPVILDRERVQRGKARAILVNAGCANACTGQDGYRDALESSRWVAEALGLAEEDVLVASTGVIGVPLPMGLLEAGIAPLVSALDEEALPSVARAIMTTDARPKWTVRSSTLGGKEVRMAAVAKGAGMIHPRMATMLCFAMTDAAVPSPVLRRSLMAALDGSFHAITVDGDTSTNDTVLVLANGASGAPPVEDGSPLEADFTALLHGVLEEMALAIVRDAEGATKTIHLHVRGAKDREEARIVASVIAHSPLVKTAFYGGDVNWGRILAAAGRSGVEVDPERMQLWYEDVQLVRSGRGVGGQAEEAAKEVAARKEFTVTLDLGMGQGEAVMHTCDLSHEYVTINASYKT
ncbi:MAG: bifunctional glutamate N-acetyltransferase/amino-acid acetyltransferase ArgJ [Thermodesulfobacteriota bacterium]